jgi:hypothetical protein
MLAIINNIDKSEDTGISKLQCRLRSSMNIGNSVTVAACLLHPSIVVLLLGKTEDTKHLEHQT